MIALTVLVAGSGTGAAALPPDPVHIETLRLRDSGLAYVLKENEAELEGNYSYRLHIDRRPTSIIEVSTHEPEVKAWRTPSGMIIGSVEHLESGSLTHMAAQAFRKAGGEIRAFPNHQAELKNGTIWISPVMLGFEPLAYDSYSYPYSGK